MSRKGRCVAITTARIRGTTENDLATDPGHVRAIRADLSTNEGRQTACSVLKKEIDALHVLVNNAGTNKRIPTLSVSAEDSTETLSFRFRAVSRPIRRVKGCVVIRTGSH